MTLILEYDNYIVFEWYHNFEWEYWISNSEVSAMIFAFGQEERMNFYKLFDLANSGYFTTEEIMLDRI